MKYIKNTVWCLMVIVFTALATGCEDGLPDYRGGDFVSFQRPDAQLSFLEATTEERPSQILEIPLAIGGFTADVDRHVTAAAVEDEPDTPERDRKTTATADEYTIIGGTIPAGEVYGTFSIELKNPERLKNEDIYLRIALQPSPDFELGLQENYFIDIRWTRVVLQPVTWNTMRTYFCSTYSTVVYRMIIDIIGANEIPDGTHTQQLMVWGRKFSDKLREYELENGHAMLHNDGVGVGTIIIPRY